MRFRCNGSKPLKSHHPGGRYTMKFKSQEKQNQLWKTVIIPHQRVTKRIRLLLRTWLRTAIIHSFTIHQKTFEELRVFLSNRDSVVTRLVSTKNQIHRWVNLMCRGSLATLRLFPTPEDLVSLQPQDVVRGWKSLMKRQPGEIKAQTLIALASHSVGSKQATCAYKLH